MYYSRGLVGEAEDKLAAACRELELIRREQRIGIPEGTAWETMAWAFPTGVKYLSACDKDELVQVVQALVFELQRRGDDNSTKHSEVGMPAHTAA